MVDSVRSTEKFHKILLSWDYFDLTEKTNEGVFETLRQVPNKFSSVEEYNKVFEPLLLEECSAQLTRGVDGGEHLVPHQAVVTAFEYKDDFLYTKIILHTSVSESFSDNDFILLCKDNPQGEHVRPSLHALGFVESHEGGLGLRVKFFLSDETQAGNAKGTERIRLMRSELPRARGCWWVLRLANTSTIAREWVALQHLHLVPFYRTLLDGSLPVVPPSRHLEIPPGMERTMSAECNGSQMQALQAGLDGTPVVLIQGPPGTGKTRTILNLLSVIMHSSHKGRAEAEMQAGRQAAVAASADSVGLASLGIRPVDADRLWMRQSPWLAAGGSGGVRETVLPEGHVRRNPHLVGRPDLDLEFVAMGTTTRRNGHANGQDREEDGGRTEDGVEKGSLLGLCFGMLRRAPPLLVGRNSGPRAHVLVCAPSNSALDEIVMRILRTGLMDHEGNQFAPTVVRVGVKSHHLVEGVSLEAIVNSRLEGCQSGKSLSGMERDRLRVTVLDEAHIVCATLSFAGSGVFYRLSRKFDVVVVDEAAQCVEPSVLVPLVMGCKQAYFVGDPVQLPATVISTRAVERGYDCSMFKRLQAAGFPVHVLDTQYRMHPDISRFPSQEFYEGRLVDGESVLRAPPSPWHRGVFGPFSFLDVPGRESVPVNGASLMNKAEAKMVLCIYRELVLRFPQLRTSPSVGVISPYKAQVNYLRDKFKKALGDEGARMVDVNTIDGFQGREKDICIFSCVRGMRRAGQRGRGIGFVADERRVNVGLTRAKCSLIVIGNTKALQVDEHWSNLIRGALERGCLFRPKPPYEGWVTEASAGEVIPAVATPEELRALERARQPRTSKAERKAAAAAAAEASGGVAGEPNAGGSNAPDNEDDMSYDLYGSDEEEEALIDEGDDDSHDEEENRRLARLQAANFDDLLQVAAKEAVKNTNTKGNAKGDDVAPRNGNANSGSSTPVVRGGSAGAGVGGASPPATEAKKGGKRAAGEETVGGDTTPVAGTSPVGQSAQPPAKRTRTTRTSGGN